MEVENNNNNSSSTTITCTVNDHNKELREDDGDVQLPGFRFHPTDQELVGFYLKRKVENRPITIQLIKLADIYKYDPWDLPKSGGNVGDKEWYFFCKRGRKYRNSIRPNRVTGSGFWKATGIDKPIYSSSGGRDCIGLKKSLVYYRGCAGKGTKTDWMMHEFRLPLPKCTKHVNDQEAEVWTLCRILKKNVSYRKCLPDITTMNNPIPDASSKTCSSSVDSSRHYNINFNNAPTTVSGNADQQFPAGQYDFRSPQLITSSQQASSAAANASISGVMADWEDLRSIVDCATVGTIDNHFHL